MLRSRLFAIRRDEIDSARFKEDICLPSVYEISNFNLFQMDSAEILEIGRD